MNAIISRSISIEGKILFIRGQKVIVDFELAYLYRVANKRLNEQVKRNIRRFPPDFMFQLNNKEFKILKSQFATSSWGGRRKLPYAFTELGIAMLSSVLNSEHAIQMNIFIMRAFVRLRKIVSDNKDLSNKVNKLELEQMKQEVILAEIYSKIRELINKPEQKKDKIGFSRQ